MAHILARLPTELLACSAATSQLAFSDRKLLSKMQNKPFHSAFDEDGFGRASSLIDPPANTRIFLLCSLFAGFAIIVLCRLIWVQTQLQDRYLDTLSTTTTEYEVIPARDGRILTESSEVLAADIDQHQLQIHYRWLQDPVDEAWLKRQVRRRLSRPERRDADLVQETTNAIKQQRLKLWRDIIFTAGVAPEAFRKQQLRIQKRVQRIADSVNERRAQAANTSVPANDSDTMVMQWATAVREALTTSPRRTSGSRIAVREEESFHNLLDNVPLSVVATVEEQQHRFPGIRVTTENQRSYPQPNIAPHIVGARRRSATNSDAEDNVDETARHRSKALFGVEQSYDHVLQGLPGRRRIVRSRRYEILESTVEREAVAGRDITLTINEQLQQQAQQLLDNALKGIPPSDNESTPSGSEQSAEPKTLPLGGCVVVMEVQTGRIMAAASAPSFSLSLFTGATQQQWDQVNQDGRHPFLFRATQMAIPPGSAVKPLTAVAAMATGHLNPIEPFHCQGFLTTPDQRRCLIYRLYGQSHGDILLKNALAQSCNVYFFDAARKTGTQDLSSWFDRFGLGRPTGIDLPSEESGQLPRTSPMPSGSSSAQQQTAMGIAIGQNKLTTTPLQMTTAIAAIANGGYVVTPHVVGETGAAHLNAAIDSSPQQRVRNSLALPDSRLLQFVQEGMKATVQSPRGTAYKTARLPDISFAGKTGTAQSAPGKNDHAWFVGYVPSDKPQYAFTVVLEHGGSGSKTAAPIAKQIIRRMQQLGLLDK